MVGVSRRGMYVYGWTLASVKSNITKYPRQKKSSEDILMGALTMSRTVESGWSAYAALVLGAASVRHVCSLIASLLISLSTHNKYTGIYASPRSVRFVGWQWVLLQGHLIPKTTKSTKKK